MNEAMSLLRERLNYLVSTRNNPFNDPDILKLSTLMDKLVLEYQKELLLKHQLQEVFTA